MAGPPERPLLHRRGADERPDEARDAVHLERAVREVAVERERQADRAQEVRGRPQADQRPGERDGEHEQRRRLDGPEHDELHDERSSNRSVEADRAGEVPSERDVSLLLRTLLLRVGRDGSTDAALRGSRTAADRARAAAACSAGDFSSTTTVTGLPSTPSRNVMRQPQASRACVNPFSISFDHTSSTGYRSDLISLSKSPWTRGRCAFAQILPSREITHGDGNAPHRAVRVLHVVVVQPLEHRVVHLHSATYGFSFSSVSSTETPTTCRPLGPVLLLELDEPRNLDLARAAPRRPEVEQDDLALEVGERHVLVLDVLQREVQVGRLRVRRTRGARAPAASRWKATARSRSASSARARARHRRDRSHIASLLLAGARNSESAPPDERRLDERRLRSTSARARARPARTSAADRPDGRLVAHTLHELRAAPSPAA